MTVIVAAYCDDAKCGVVAADRMAVRGAGSSAAQRDDAVCKIVQLTDTMAIGNTGYAFDATYVKDRFLGEEEHNTWSLTEICRFVSETLADLQIKKRDAEVQRQLGRHFSYDKLVEACSKGVGGPFLDAFKSANELNYGEFLMVGFEDGRIAIRCDPSPQTLGMLEVDYAATGSGYHYAHAALTIARHKRTDSLETAVVNVYCAIRAAAVSFGVGSVIDMAIVNSNGVAFAPRRLFETLEQLLASKSLTDDDRQRISEVMRGDDAADEEAD